VSTFRHQHAIMRDGTETFRIDLPYGCGYVEIRAEKHVRSGNPMFTTEVVSDSLDKPALDGRLYEQEIDTPYNAIHLIGREDKQS